MTEKKNIRSVKCNPANDVALATWANNILGTDWRYKKETLYLTHEGDLYLYAEEGVHHETINRHNNGNKNTFEYIMPLTAFDAVNWIYHRLDKNQYAFLIYSLQKDIRDLLNFCNDYVDSKQKIEKNKKEKVEEIIKILNSM